jgi:hypothetical protein
MDDAWIGMNHKATGLTQIPKQQKIITTIATPISTLLLKFIHQEKITFVSAMIYSRI